MGSLWAIIVRLIALSDGFLQYLVNVSVEFTKASDGQWEVAVFNAALTPKGNAILADLATITHHGLDFLAQVSAIFPAQANVLYNGPTVIGP
jgi:hypothetical protein